MNNETKQQVNLDDKKIVLNERLRCDRDGFCLKKAYMSGGDRYIVVHDANLTDFEIYDISQISPKSILSFPKIHDGRYPDYEFYFSPNQRYFAAKRDGTHYVSGI